MMAHHVIAMSASMRTMLKRLAVAFAVIVAAIALPATAASIPSTPLPSEPPEQVSLAIVGDVMLASKPGNEIARGRDPLGPFGAIFAAADIRVANLECVVASGGRAEPGKPWTFRAHPRTVTILKRHLDAVSLANNHSGDYGPEGFGEMLDLLDRANIGVFGGGRNLTEAHAPLIIERKGLRIALLGYDEFFPRNFEADTDKPGVAWSEDEQVQRDIIAARNVYHADLVIPFMHWGSEHEPLANPRQRTLARLMIDAGADAVIGSHPHVTQDVETYRGKPIVYSLGNFVFDGFSDGKGTPHPRPDLPAQCWERGTTQAHACRATSLK
jgi:hypothetical protein